MQNGVATELTDGFAFGVTALMALTGLPTTDIKQRCRHMLKWPTQPEKWQPPGVPDAAAGGWDGEAASGLVEMVNGLQEVFAEDRTPLAEVLQRLEAMAAAAVADEPEATPTAAEEEERLCIICEAAPREVRFSCGHAIVCSGCLPSVVQQHRKCPTCGVAFGAEPVMERGQHVGAAPTFVLPPARGGK